MQCIVLIYGSFFTFFIDIIAADDRPLHLQTRLPVTEEPSL
jgi:hypothetical protein